MTTSAIYALIHKLEKDGGVWWAKGGTNRLVAGMVKHFERLGGKLRLHEVTAARRRGDIALGGELAAVVSNHEDLRPRAEAAGLPFVHVPVTPATKADAEARLLELIDEHRADLVVLARYMQILSDDACDALYGRAINIHHSFLPGFKGAKPYHQAFDRGVKLVGATAHYVTPELDEGPIIEQEVMRIDHTHDPKALATVGRDAEALALSRAVRWHCEQRVLLNGSSTVIFR